MKRTKRKQPPAQPAARVGESGTVLAVTVLWMLTGLLSLGAEIGVAACLLSMRIWPAAQPGPDVRPVMIAALLLAALATGALCLGLTPLAWRLRSVKPPVGIVVIAVLVGIAPIVTLVVLSRR